MPNNSIECFVPIRNDGEIDYPCFLSLRYTLEKALTAIDTIDAMSFRKGDKVDPVVAIRRADLVIHEEVF